jgi:hypothetical protein
VTKFSLRRFPPSLFDVSQDIVRALPVDIIERWTRGDQSRETALRLLEPQTRTGTAVVSDSAGLTRLGAHRGLVEILAMISQPKELIHAHGVAIGGGGVGVWAADNTQMFFGDEVEPRRIVSMLLELQARIAAECEVQVGIGAHCGRFYRLGDGLYGAEADRVETLAESYTAGGEIVLTSALVERLGDGHGLRLRGRDDVPGELGAAYRVEGGPRLRGLVLRDFDYPVPYSPEFFADLRQYAADRRDLALLDRIHARYTRELAVVLIEREREEPDVPEVAVLNDLALSLAMKTIGARLLEGTSGAETKTAGPLGIYTFEDCREALAFARGFRQTLREQGIASRIGIDHGEVLVFQLQHGGHDIAGMPVNLASKMAQDTGEFGNIYLTPEAAGRAGGDAGAPRVTFTASGVSLDARVV